MMIFWRHCPGGRQCPGGNVWETLSGGGQCPGGGQCLGGNVWEALSRGPMSRGQCRTFVTLSTFCFSYDDFRSWITSGFRALHPHSYDIWTTEIVQRQLYRVQSVKTRCKAKPDCSPPGYLPSRLLITVNWSVNWFACVSEAVALLVVRRHLANRTRTQ